MALTEPAIDGRILGASRTVDVSTRTVILSSGNNVEPVSDCYADPFEPAGSHAGNSYIQTTEPG